MKKAGIIIASAVILALGAGFGATQIHLKPSKIESFGNYVTAAESLTVPDNARIIALGEATHGNKEFQELKLSVFRTLVETTNVRGLILEGDFGGCALANEYINGGEGTAEDITRKLGYRIYRTDEMCELITWMREYNETAAENDKVRIYGADIQNDMCTVQVIKNFYTIAAPEKAEEISSALDELFGTEEDAYSPSDYDRIISFIDETASELDADQSSYEAAAGKEKFATARRAFDMLRCYMEYREKQRFSTKYRDTQMKENVMWALGIEESDHDSRLMLSCHNGHMTKNQSSVATFLGRFLHDDLGDDYFAIGTDFYITKDNLPGKNGREVHKFCSDDPLAYQVKYSDENMCYLDFSSVPENDPVYEKIHNPMKTGSLGEQYNLAIKLVKPFYQLNLTPEDMYDAMILVYEANPTEIWTE
ncbi:MAG: erythromycin esterase family protein [Ruminococcus sp.]|nr:erythromycin esterase family protein [Ruminococcus sp.]